LRGLRVHAKPAYWGGFEVTARDPINEQIDPEALSDRDDARWELSERDASEADVLDQFEAADPSDDDADPGPVIRDLEVSEADALDQAIAVPPEDDW